MMNVTMVWDWNWDLRYFAMGPGQLVSVKKVESVACICSLVIDIAIGAGRGGSIPLSVKSDLRLPISATFLGAVLPKR